MATSQSRTYPTVRPSFPDKPGSSRTNVWAIIGIVVLAIALIAGYVMFFKSKERTQQAACALVIDRTSSVGSLTPTLRHMASVAVQGCASADASLSVWYLDQRGVKANLAASSIPLWGGSFSPKVSDQKREAALARANRAVGKAFADQTLGPTRGSDLVTAVYTAASSLKSDAAKAGISHLYLIVLTDGIQSSTGTVSVVGLTNPGADVAPLIAQVKQDGLVPPLQGVSVDMVGVKGGQTLSGQQPTAAFEANVQRFWQQYVAAGGGSIGTYQAVETELPRG